MSCGVKNFPACFSSRIFVRFIPFRLVPGRFVVRAVKLEGSILRLAALDLFWFSVFGLY